eukprot:6210470-Pleurochrysis_carterae.AAC.2
MPFERGPIDDARRSSGRDCGLPFDLLSDLLSNRLSSLLPDLPPGAGPVRPLGLWRGLAESSDSAVRID